MRAPRSGGSRFLSIERLDHRPPHIGDTLRLNLRAVGVSAPSFSHYYYMVCMSWAVEESRGAGRGSGRKEPLCGGMVSGLGCAVKQKLLLLLLFLAQILSRGQIVSVNREPRRPVTSVSLFVDHHLAPSFYFVAFYYEGGLPVANSLRVNVQAGACEGKVIGMGETACVCVRGVKRERRQGDCEEGMDLVWGALRMHRRKLSPLTDPYLPLLPAGAECGQWQGV